MYDDVMGMTELESIQRRLEAGLADVCGHLNVLHEQLVTLTREAVETEAWAGHGIHSPEHWLAWQTGLAPERAKQIVAMGPPSERTPGHVRCVR